MNLNLFRVSSVVVLAMFGAKASADRVANGRSLDGFTPTRQMSQQAPTRNSSGKGSCGLASVYAPGDRDRHGKNIGGGKLTAVGHPVDGGGYPSIATLGQVPLNSVVLVTYGGRTAKACADDTGAFAKYGRSFDLGPQLTSQLGASGVKNACIQSTGEKCRGGGGGGKRNRRG